MNVQELSAIFPRKVWLADEEVPWLFAKAGQSQGCIVEIGAAYGGSATVLLLGKSRHICVISIDPFVADLMEGFRATEAECRAAVQQAVGETLYRDWALIARPSAKVAATWSDPIGLLYLDGDHSYEGVEQDFELWTSHLLPDASVILHDSRRLSDADPRIFARGWQGPTQLVIELEDSRRYEVVDVCFSMSELKRI